MSSIHEPYDHNAASNLNTETLEEDRPHTVALHAAPARVEVSAGTIWDQRVNAPCNRDPTVDLEQDEIATVTEHQAAVVASDAPPSAPSAAPSVVELAAADPPVPEAAASTVQLAASNVTVSTLLRGRYQLDCAIAAGGSAIIYRASDSRRAAPRASSASIAIKLLKAEFRTDAKSIERLKREYEYTVTAVHPNIVRVFDLDYCDTYGWFITMELLDGQSLAALIRSHGSARPSSHAALAIITSCGRALSFAHTHGIFHCDIKPSNVMVTKAERVCVLDFGAAYTPTAAAPTAQRAAAATPAYASPQILSGELIDARDDLFSLACVSYELLTGRHPFGYASASATRDYERQLVRPSQVSAAQWQALRRALSRDRNQRQASVAAFLKEFDSRSARLLWWLGAAATTLVISGLALLTHSLLTHPRAGNLPTAHTTHSATSAKAQPALPEVTPTPTTAVASGDGSRVNEAPASTPTQSTTAVVPSPASIASKDTPSREALTRRDTRVTVATHPAVAFEQSNLTVSELAVAAALTISRADASDVMRIQWRIKDGTARAGVDYEPVAASTAVFAKHQTSRTLFINLKKNAAARGDRTFTVEVRKAASNATDIARAEVTIRSAAATENAPQT